MTAAARGAGRPARWAAACLASGAALVTGSVLAQTPPVAPAASTAPPAAAPSRPAPAEQTVRLLCDAVYQPARTNWLRTVDIAFDGRRVRRVLIDGVPVYTFTVFETTILTALDNERIQIDTATQLWTSDFRGQATGAGRCERG